MDVVENSCESESKVEGLGETSLDETIENDKQLNEIKDEFDGELGVEEPFLVETRDVSPIGENRSVSPAEEVDSRACNLGMNVEGLDGGDVSGGSPSSKNKGFGLKKKWRRVRRQLNKDETGGVDSGYVLKRRMPLPEPPKDREEHKLKSDGEGDAEVSVASVDSNIVAPSVAVAVVPTELDPELGVLAAAGFAVGIDSDHGEDRCSKSSTPVSGPRSRHDAIGFGRERNRIRSVGGRGSGHLAQQRGQKARGGVVTSKKYSGGQSRVEKENSYSSVESDLRSSNIRFAQWASVTSNGKKSEKSGSYDGEHSDDAQPSEEVRSSYHKENGLGEHSSRVDLDAGLLEENTNSHNGNCHDESEPDPFIESIASLKAAQEALENEIQKFVEVRKEAMLDDADSQYEGTEGNSSPTSEAHFAELIQKIDQLETKLKDALATAKIKESKVLELEALLKKAESSNKEMETIKLASLQDKYKELEIELQSMFERKLEAELVYLIMTRTTQNWKVLAEDQIALAEEQNILAADQTEMKLKLGDAKDEAILLKVRSEKLEDHCKKLLEEQQVLQYQNKVCKYSLCFLVQLVLLFIIFALLYAQFLQPTVEVVPT